MGSEWKEASLGELIRLQRGHDLTDGQRKPGEIPVMGSAGLNGFHNTSKAKGPGLVIGRSGASFGRVHYSIGDYWPHNTALYVTDFLGNDELFTFYLLKTIDFSSYNSGSAQPSLNRNHIYLMPVHIPPLPDQKAIAHILGSLDDKIELNQRMNATLEQMAQTLFKSWFVDFDPVIDNALAAGNPIPEELAERAEIRSQALANGTANRQAAKNFPDAFQLTEEMGWIPEGWEAGTIGDVAKAVGGFAFKSQAFQESGFPVIKIKNIVGDGTVSIEGAQCIGAEDANNALKFCLHDGDLLMAMTGATVGKIGLVVNGNKRAFLKQRVAKLIGRSIEKFSSFLYCFFKDQANFEQIVGTAGGSAQPNISSSGIESVQCVIPKNDHLVKFTELVDPNFEKWISNYKLSKSLSSLRDTLLPKLIAGELRIEDAEKMVEAI